MIIEPPNPKADRRYLGPHGKHGNLAERDANVIPLIDVVFILILYFLLAGSLDQELVEALLPPQSKSLTQAPQKVPFVTVDKDGKVTYQKAQLDDAALVKALNADGHPPPKIALQAEEQADAGRVADVIALIGRAGIGDLSLITRPAAIHR
ncbi:MAG: biopolymer transporter ExbD [Proteobacteria bacterium]|nr:biopolymer transporter ExbD [Pseudomonadota bacterium]